MIHHSDDTGKVSTVLPFRRPVAASDDVQTTTIAVLVAVTVLHDAKTSAESRLLEIIESSGEAEVLGSEDTFVELGLNVGSQRQDETPPANDNRSLRPCQ